MYRELAAHPAQSETVKCLWLHRTELARPARVVPDACIDLIWDGSRLLVAGPDTRPWSEPMKAGRSLFGLRMHTGVAPQLLGVPASALRDARVELHELWHDRALRVQDALQRGDAHALLQRLVQDTPAADALIAMTAERLRARPMLRIAGLAAELGVSERQLNRRVTQAVGYGPKMLARVLRMQTFARAVKHSTLSLAALASQCGFVDQAHLGHEAAELYGTTPTRMRV